MNHARGSQRTPTASTGAGAGAADTGKRPQQPKRLFAAGFADPFHVARVQDPRFSIDRLAPPWRMVRATPKYWQRLAGERERAEVARLDAMANKGADLTLEQKLLVQHGSWRGAMTAAVDLARSEAAKERGPRADMSKVAPSVGISKKKQRKLQQKSKTYILGQEDHPASAAAAEARRERYSWMLMDVDEAPEKTWVGSMDQDLASSYVLFVENEHGFTVCPLGKRYRFVVKPPRSTAPSDRALQQMKERLAMFGKDPQDLLAAGRFGSGAKTETPEKVEAAQEAESDDEGGRRRAGSDLDVEDAALDYDDNELFADDDDEELGVDDSDMVQQIQKKRRVEARRANRNHVEGVDVDEDDRLFGSDAEGDAATGAPDPRRLQELRKERRLLAQSESNDAYILHSDDENPYLSDDEDDASDASDAPAGDAAEGGATV